jgi:hypothetical protein
VSADDAERVRVALEAAQETGDPDDRRDCLVEALDAALALRDEGVRGAESLFSTIAEAGNAPDYEADHFIGRAVHELDTVERAVEAGECLESDEYTGVNAEGVGECECPGLFWADEDTAVVEVELSRPIFEWIQLETDEDETVEEWLERQAFITLTKVLRNQYGSTVDATVDVSEAFAERVELYAEAAGYEPGDEEIEGLVVNHSPWSHEYLVEGEPWDLVEGDCDE